MLKLNIGSCDLPLPKPWINIDNSNSPHIKADLLLDGRNLLEYFSLSSVDEIYAGHFVEHLTPEEASSWFKQCFQVLKPGGIIGFVTPDFRYLAEEYLQGTISLDKMNNLYVFSYDQESHHASLWDQRAQMEALIKAGFMEVVPIDRIDDTRLSYGVHWQCGAEGIKP